MSLMDVLFGCQHQKLTFPISRRVRGRVQPPYVVCLDCGSEFPYDWQNMRVVPNRENSTNLFAIAVDSSV